MQLISLNTWGGSAGREKLLAFFTTHKDVDIFCLQEVMSAPYRHLEGKVVGGVAFSNNQRMPYGVQDISGLLDTHTAYFRPHQGDHYGLLTLVKKDFVIAEEGELFVHKEKGYEPEGDMGLHARNIQYATIATEKGNRTVINFHGLWNGKGKGDSEDRLRQSDNIIQFLQKLQNPYVLCGDFNLLPDTESLQKLERFGLHNLIKENGITSTRTSFYTKPEKFADYTLVSDGIKVSTFRILPDEVSDHSPMFLDFE